MKKLLHIIATPRGADSRTLKVSGAFLEALRQKYPSCEIETLDLFKENIPPITVKKVDGKYALLGGKDLTGELKEAWKDIIKEIERFLLADTYLISTPMWNFSIPYVLKHYIDIIIQPKYLFRYTDKGVDGLAKGRKMIVITSRGGDYSPGSPAQPFDLLTPYLKTVFGFVGITDLTFINAQPMDASGPKIQEEKIRDAQKIAEKLAQGL